MLKLFLLFFKKFNFFFFFLNSYFLLKKKKKKGEIAFRNLSEIVEYEPYFYKNKFE